MIGFILGLFVGSVIGSTVGFLMASCFIVGKRHDCYIDGNTFSELTGEYIAADEVKITNACIEVRP